MKNVDYEQLYYDELYENKKLKEKITELEQEKIIKTYKEILEEIGGIE